MERDKFLVIIYELCLSIAVFYLMYYFHECGHFIAAKISGFKKITVGYTNRYFLKVPNEVNLDAKEISTIKHKKIKLFFTLISGPALGIIPIIGAYHFSNMNFNISMFLLAGFYILVVCIGDYKEIVDLVPAAK